MSQTSVGLKASPLERFRNLRRAHRGSLGIAEIIGLGLAALMVLAVIVGYFYLLVPAQSRSAGLIHERDHLKQQLRVAHEAFNRDFSVKTRVDEIKVSLEKFEDHRLADRDGGRMALYETLNQLIHKNGLRNTSGPAYTSLDPLVLKAQGQVAQTGSAVTANKWQSIYPGIGVNVTVEGSYQSLRHFVHDIEGSKEFVIINAVELERATGSNAQPAPEEGAPKSGAANALVSLRMDLASYFSRPAQSTEKPVAAAVH